VPEPVGCFATIESWDMPQLGLFQLIAHGGGRFRIREMKVAPNHLISATVESIPEDAPGPGVDPLCREVLQAVIDKVGTERFPAPARLDDAAWVGYRLAEILPLDMRLKQELLELTDASARLERLHALLAQQGLAAQRSDK
jgi:Lon protease-like protein